VSRSHLTSLRILPSLNALFYASKELLLVNTQVILPYIHATQL
jgi:hypothetical protein